MVSVPDAAAVLNAALAYQERGWSPTPVNGKGAILKDWPNRRLETTELRAHFADKPLNVGVVLGAPSRGLVDVDLDSPEALAIADIFLPPTSSIFGRAGKPKSHRLYYCDPPPTNRRFPDQKTMLVELRSTGSQTVLPPSIHVSGDVVEFNVDAEPARVGGVELTRAVAKLAAAALLARVWPKQPGCRQDLALALAGGLLRLGWAVEDVASFIEAVAAAAGDTEAPKRATAAGYTAEAIAGGPASGWPRLAELIGDGGRSIVEKLRNWLREPLPANAAPPCASIRGRRNHDKQDHQDRQIASDRHGSARVAVVVRAPERGAMTERMARVRADYAAKRPSSLTLADHVAASVEWHRYWQDNGPPAGENWTTPTWGLLRYLRGHPDLKELRGVEALEVVATVLAQWATADSTDPCEHCSGLPGEDFRAQFVFGWEEVKYIPGYGPLDAAMDRAKVRPLPIPAAHHVSDEYVAFLGMAGYLQALIGERNIFLPVEAVSKVCGVGRNTISLWRKVAVRQGYLTPRVLGRRHLADEYRFSVEQFAALREAAERAAPVASNDLGEATPE